LDKLYIALAPLTERLGNKIALNQARRRT